MFVKFLEVIGKWLGQYLEVLVGEFEVFCFKFFQGISRDVYECGFYIVFIKRNIWIRLEVEGGEVIEILFQYFFYQIEGKK